MSRKVNFSHQTEIQIRFNDIDIMEHVNNSVYQNYFDLARTKYFEHVFNQKMNWKEQALVLAKITIEYLNPVFIDENICVRTKVYKLGNKSLNMVQQLINKDSKELKAENDAILVAFSHKENNTTNLPEHWRKAIRDYENDPSLI
ncbi:MAG: thioesterase family protein [Bacteroidales bacterium]